MKLNITFSLSFLLLQGTSWQITKAAAAAAAANTNDNNNEDECGLYLAVSSISDLDAVRWGVFAGVDIPAGTLVGEPDIAIQTHNLLGHAHSSSPKDQSDHPTVRSVNMFEEYIWVPDTTGGSRDMKKPGRMVSAILGAGFLGAYNGKLTNTEWFHGGAFLRESMGETAREAHAGRGASSHFYNITLVSTEDISAGSEIFMDYGSNWEDDEDDEEDGELNKKDFKRVDEFINQMVEFFKRHEEELTGVAKTEIYDFLVRDIISAAAGPKKGKKISALLPKTFDGLEEVQKQGSLLFSQPKAKQKIEWLKENGLCMDNLEVGASTVPHAGRGAFAKRRIPEGGLIAPVPMMHIPDKTMMNMYEVTRGVDDDGDKFMHRVNDEIVGQQLLLNYCFGHADSSLLLIPTGTLTGFINHATSSGKKKKQKKPNAKLVFSKHPESQQQNNMVEMTPQELLKEDFIGIVMEIVALRPIEKGDEILLDYGDEWQAAWDAHEKEWNAKVKKGDLPNPWPLRALDLNQEYKTKPYPTTSDYIPENIRQVCFLVVRTNKDNQKTWGIPKKGNVFDDENIFDCTVKESIQLDDPQPESIGGLAYNYTITWTNHREEDESEEVINVPHQAILFLDQPDTSDQFVKESFRHAIHIPDDVFPKAWKDRLVVVESSDDDDSSSAGGEHEEL